MNVLGRWRRLSQDVSRSLYALQMRCHPALVNKLYENELLECLHLDACGSRAWTAGTYLEKLPGFRPAFEGSVHHTPCIVVHQIVVVVQVRNGSIYCRDWVRENRKRRGEMSGRYACLLQPYQSP